LKFSLGKHFFGFVMKPIHYPVVTEGSGPVKPFIAALPNKPGAALAREGELAHG
jgi:hypothetical protein